MVPMRDQAPWGLFMNLSATNPPRPLPGGERAFGRAVSVPLPGGLVGVGSGSQCMRKNERRLSMNRPFGVPALADPDRLKAGLPTSGVHTDRFRVPMHAKKRKGALHEPTHPRPPSPVR